MTTSSCWTSGRRKSATSRIPDQNRAFEELKQAYDLVAAWAGKLTQDFVARSRANGVTPHVAQNTTNRRSAIDGRTTRHAGYAVSLRKRKQIEEAFGWIKTIGGMRKTRFIGQARVAAQSLFTFAAYNLVRFGSLLGWRRAAPA